MSDKLKLSAVLLIDKIFDVKDWQINVTVRNEDGIFFCENLYHFFMYSPHREATSRPYFKVKEGETFVDVGANVGKYSIFVAKRYPKSKILAIEPDERAFKVMQKNIELNNLKNIEIVRKAASDKIGKLEFFINEENSARNSVYKEEIAGQSNYNDKNEKKDFNTHKVSIPCTTLDEISKKSGKISLIKIDVQGAETAVLMGGLKVIKRDLPQILFEAWDENHLREIKKILLPINYTFLKIDEFNFLAKHKKR